MIKKQQGFSMIEVLMTIVIISFGFLSLLSLQMRVLDDLTTNNQQTLAMYIASGMGDRIRSNQANISAYNNVDTKTNTLNCTSGCTAIADQDIWEFKQSLLNEVQLPAASGTIQSVSGVIRIIITWTRKSSNRWDNQAATTTYTYEAVP